MGKTAMDLRGMLIKRVGRDDFSQVIGLYNREIIELTRGKIDFGEFEENLEKYIEDEGRIYGIFKEGKLIKYTVIEFGYSDKRVLENCGVPEDEKSFVFTIKDSLTSYEYLRLNKYLEFVLWDVAEESAKENGYKHLVLTVKIESSSVLKNALKKGMTIKKTLEDDKDSFNHYLYKKLK